MLLNGERVRRRHGSRSGDGARRRRSSDQVRASLLMGMQAARRSLIRRLSGQKEPNAAAPPPDAAAELAARRSDDEDDEEEGARGSKRKRSILQQAHTLMGGEMAVQHGQTSLPACFALQDGHGNSWYYRVEFRRSEEGGVPTAHTHSVLSG
jgi:hypothetical protein